MDELLRKINVRLQHYNRDELMALIWDFVSEREEDELADFLDLMRQKSRPAVVETLELEDADDLLSSIQELHEAIANDEYVEYGSGYDPDYGEYRGFGDDSWIDEMDSLFAAATSLYRAGNYRTAAAAYIALFDIFGLSEDGYHFTRPDPPAALQTDLNVMKQQLFTALGMLNPDPAAVLEERGEEEDAETLIELSGRLSFYGDHRYALLDAWERHPEWIRSLEAHLLQLCRHPAHQERSGYYGLSHHAELLREAYRRSHSLAEREMLCREVGPQQGWPYEDLISAYQDHGQWVQALAWADDGLAKLPPQSVYRLMLEEARGSALLRLDRPAEALAALQSLFERKRDVSVYLTLRTAAQATGDWAQLYPQLTAEVERQVLTEIANPTSGFMSGSLIAAALLGYAYLLEGQIERAVAWAVRPDIPVGWNDDDLTSTVALGLLHMGLAAARATPDDVLREALSGAPKLVREQGDLLDATAVTVPPNPFFDGAVRTYERLLERAVNGRKRESYAVAGSYARVIGAIRKLQGRGSEFDAYYRSLFESYARLPAFKDELRNAIEGPGYKRKR
jgi:tetratricopeptide (TPR) repeat protein